MDGVTFIPEAKSPEDTVSIVSVTNTRPCSARRRGPVASAPPGSPPDPPYPRASRIRASPARSSATVQPLNSDSPLRAGLHTRRQASANSVPKTRGSRVFAHAREAGDSPPILTVKSSATMQLRAARSLCTNLLALRYAMPSAISPAIWIILLRLGGMSTTLFCWRLKKKKSHLQNHALFQGLHIHLCSVTLSPAGHAAKEPGLAQKERVIIETVASGSGSSHAPAG